MIEWLYALRGFLESGGPVLPLVLLLSTLMWYLILGRYWYYRMHYPRQLSRIARQARISLVGSALAVRLQRRALLLQLEASLHERLGIIRTCTHLLPLLGLLGTVTGMVSIFDLMNIVGTGSLHGMSGSISRALLPTATGLSTSLIGIGCHADLRRRADICLQRADALWPQGI